MRSLAWSGRSRTAGPCDHAASSRAQTNVPSEIHHFKYKIHHLKYKVHHFNTKFIVFNTNSDTTATIRPRIHTRAHACTGTSQHFAREIEWEIADSLSLPLYLSGGLGRAAEAEGNY